MSQEFISREEFRDLRDDIKTDNQAIIATVKEGFSQVNSRLDIVNGRLYKHEGAIAANQAQINSLNEFAKNGPGMSKKAKAVIATGGGVSILAVLHSMFEMVKAVGPAVLKAFTGH
jgi:hypothetical protein